MTDTTISVRIDKNIKEKMNMQEHINWSAILRRAILQHLENANKIDLERAKKASKEIDKIRKKIREEAEKNIEMDDSDIPVHERFVKEDDIKKIKKRRI